MPTLNQVLSRNEDCLRNLSRSPSQPISSTRWLCWNKWPQVFSPFFPICKSIVQRFFLDFHFDFNPSLLFFPHLQDYRVRLLTLSRERYSRLFMPCDSLHIRRFITYPLVLLVRSRIILASKLLRYFRCRNKYTFRSGFYTYTAFAVLFLFIRGCMLFFTVFASFPIPTVRNLPLMNQNPWEMMFIVKKQKERGIVVDLAYVSSTVWRLSLRAIICRMMGLQMQERLLEMGRSYASSRYTVRKFEK